MTTYNEFLEEYTKLMDVMRHKVTVEEFLKMNLRTAVAQTFYCAPDENIAIQTVEEAIAEGIAMFRREDNQT